uniref:Uncharacterized protein n=1 Tax=Rhizophora mucronata TaxID=61149 RepID=A0A2P2PJ90_RHIMU
MPLLLLKPGLSVFHESQIIPSSQQLPFVFILLNNSFFFSPLYFLLGFWSIPPRRL